MAEKVAKLEELQQSHTKRPHILQVKAAKYGLECPASIELEIVEIGEKIKIIVDEIEFITGSIKELRDLIDESLSYTLEEREYMLAAMNKRKIKLAREVKKRDKLGDNCPPELLKQIDRDKKFIQRVTEAYNDSEHKIKPS